MIHSRQRVFYYDLILCYCVIFAILAHITYHFYSDTECIWWLIIIGCGTGMVIMSSGAKILPLREPTSRFLKRRLSSFVPEFVLYSVAYMLLYAYVKCDPNYFIDRQLEWFFFTPAFGPAWFIYALIGVYLFAPIISPWIAQASKRDVEYFLVIWLMSGFIPLAAKHVHVVENILFFAPFATFVGYFVAGYYLTHWPVRERPRKEQWAFWGITAFFGIIFAAHFVRTGLRWGFAEIFKQDASINIMAMAMLQFALCQYVTRAPRLIEMFVNFVARNSLHLYLCHLAVIEFVVMPLNLGYWSTVAISFVASFAIGWALAVISRAIRRRLSSTPHHRLQ